MRLAALISLLCFSFAAQAVIEDQATRYPMVICTNKDLIAQVFSMENRKDALLMVRDASRTENNIIYNKVVRPMDATDDSQLFLSGDASLRVVPNGKILKGFLNLHRNQPGVGQVLDCQAYFRILSAEM